METKAKQIEKDPTLKHFQPFSRSIKGLPQKLSCGEKCWWQNMAYSKSFHINGFSANSLACLQFSRTSAVVDSGIDGT